jgi:carbon storage regulator CsrA
VLVLARKVDGWIQIGPDIRVMVVSVEGGTVRLGVTAPRELTVLRGPEMVNPDGTPKPKPKRKRQEG